MPLIRRYAPRVMSGSEASGDFSLSIGLRTALQLADREDLSSKNSNSCGFQRDCLGRVLAWLGK